MSCKEILGGLLIFAQESQSNANEPILFLSTVVLRKIQVPTLGGRSSPLRRTVTRPDNSVRGSFPYPAMTPSRGQAKNPPLGLSGTNPSLVLAYTHSPNHCKFI